MCLTQQIYEIIGALQWRLFSESEVRAGFAILQSFPIRNRAEIDLAFFPFGHAVWHMRLQFPFCPGRSPWPLQWKRRALTTGPPGDSPAQLSQFHVTVSWSAKTGSGEQSKSAQSWSDQPRSSGCGCWKYQGCIYCGAVDRLCTRHRWTELFSYPPEEYFGLLLPFDRGSERHSSPHF